MITNQMIINHDHKSVSTRKMIKFFILIALVYSAAQAAPRIEQPPDNSIRAYYRTLDKKNETLSSACNECKLIVSEFKNVIKDPSKLNRLKVVLKLLCDYVGGSEAQDCKNMVDNLDFIVHELEPFMPEGCVLQDDPEKFCQEIHLCGKRSSTYKILVLKAVKFATRTANSDRPMNNDLLCDECVFATTEVNNMIHSADIQQELKREFEQICQIYPKYKQQNDPKKFCTKIQMCGKSGILRVADQAVTDGRFSMMHKIKLNRIRQSGPVSRLFVVAPLLQTARGHNVVCVICQFGLESLIREIKQNNIAISRKISRSVCNLLPNDDLQQDCLDFASIYSSSLLFMFTDEWTPNQLCADMQMCSNETAAILNSMTSEDRTSTLCEACHTFSEFISFEFRQQGLQQQITAMVKEEICAVLPGDLSHQVGAPFIHGSLPKKLSRHPKSSSEVLFTVELALCCARVSYDFEIHELIQKKYSLHNGISYEPVLEPYMREGVFGYSRSVCAYDHAKNRGFRDFQYFLSIAVYLDEIFVIVVVVKILVIFHRNISHKKRMDDQSSADPSALTFFDDDEAKWNLTREECNGVKKDAAPPVIC
uniref:Saposin B-type domain-containing protein n=1 Tax=Romanomermis culicivorax TaxID=13658 RepID=A0A915KYY1_ROMCU